MPYADPDTNLFVLTKQPWEESPFDMDFSGRLRDGDSLSSIASVTVTNMGKVTASADAVAANEVVSGSIAQVTLSAGDDGENYKITIRAITTSGAKVEGDGMLYVRDL